MPRLQAASCVLCWYQPYVRESRGGCVHFLWLRDNQETRLFFVAFETKATHSKGGSVLVSLSAVAVSHRTTAQASIIRDREDSLQGQAAKPHVVYRMTFGNCLQELSLLEVSPP